MNESGGVLVTERRIADDRNQMVSVIIPIYDEGDNIDPLFTALLPVLRALGRDSEIIAVNDGSHDSSLQRLRAASTNIPQLKVIDFRRNYGQTAAIMAGIDYASGEIIIG
jgi:glycosyltransferase involved in cell wall biosynthesis